MACPCCSRHVTPKPLVTQDIDNTLKPEIIDLEVSVHGVPNPNKQI